jgi:hypothetical protein
VAATALVASRVGLRFLPRRRHRRVWGPPFNRPRRRRSMACRS